MKNLTRYNCAYESDDDKTRVLTVDKNDDGTYFKMSIDVKNSGTNEEYVRTQAAGTFDIDGISEDMSALLGDSRSIIEDFLREQCALYYPTAVEAECNGILTADFNANEYRVDFSLKDTEDQQLTGITVVYHLSTKQCELMQRRNFMFKNKKIVLFLLVLPLVAVLVAPKVALADDDSPWSIHRSARP